jgi:hypothetical protein
MAAMNQSTAMALGHWGNCNCNGNGDGGDRSIVATATGQRRRSIVSNGATALGHWGNSNRTVLQWQWQWGVGGDVYVVLQGKTSTIVVDENVQNVWRAIIRDVLRSNKTCMFCSKIVFGVSYLYSKVELVNAFRINSSLKWSKLYSNGVSNIIISE